MIGWERRVLLRHSLNEGLTVTKILAAARDQPSDDLPLDQRRGAGPGPQGGPLQSQASGSHEAGPVQDDRTEARGGVPGA